MFRLKLTGHNKLTDEKSQGEYLYMCHKCPAKSVRTPTGLDKSLKKCNLSKTLNIESRDNGFSSGNVL